MIRFGPGGIPLSCKGRTLRDGLEDVHTLGLTAMEVQFVRVNLVERFVSEEEVGKRPRDIEGELVVAVQRKPKNKRGYERIIDPDVTMEHGDVRCSLASGIVRDYRELAELKEISKELDIFFSIHTPYYMDLIGGGEITEKSKESIKWCGILANEMGARVVVTHVGLYGGRSSEKALEVAVSNVRELRDWYKKNNINSSIGLETSGKREVFGDIDEILAVSKRVSGVIPVLNFAHVHARGNGSLKRREDFQKIFDKAQKVIPDDYYTHFSGVEYEGGSEKRYTPIKKGDLKFEPLAECILDNNFDITIISGSPLLEHDAMYMKVILERVLTRREAKAMRAKLSKTAAKEAKEKAPAEKAKSKKKPKVSKKPPKKTTKKPAKKPAKKTAGKPARNPSKKPAKKKTKKPAGKTVRKARKPAKKKSKPSSKKGVQRPTKKTAKKPPKKKARKPSGKPVKKTSKRPVKKKGRKPAGKPAKKKGKSQPGKTKKGKGGKKR